LSFSVGVFITKFLRCDTALSSMSEQLTQMTTYIEPIDIKKIKKKRGEYGLISDSAYLRHLVNMDIGKVKPPVQF